MPGMSSHEFTPAEHLARTEAHLEEIQQHHPDTGIVDDGSRSELPSGEEAAHRLDKMDIEGVSDEEIDNAIETLGQ